MNLLFPDKLFDLQNLPFSNVKLVFTNGCFDIIHSGHIQSLLFAKSKGDKLLVAINSDESIKKIKGNLRPFVPLIHRINVISALDMVDYVIAFDEETPYNLIERIRPNILIKGEDYKNKDVVGSEFVSEVYYAPFYDDISSSTLINSFIDKIQNGNSI